MLHCPMIEDHVCSVGMIVLFAPLADNSALRLLKFYIFESFFKLPVSGICTEPALACPP